MPIVERSSMSKGQQSHFPSTRSHVLPTPKETFEQHQHRGRSSSSSSTQPGHAKYHAHLHEPPSHPPRRILPLPGGAGSFTAAAAATIGGCEATFSRRGAAAPAALDVQGNQNPDESDTVRNVRMLLAHNRNVSQAPPPHLMDLGVQERYPAHTTDSFSSQFLSSTALPGDSFPTTGQHLMAASLDREIDDLDEDSEQELLRHLSQSQARMEQIKRMLVTQRGYIVQALKQLAESSANEHQTEAAPAECQNCAQVPEDFDPGERDRTMGSTVKYAAATKSVSRGESQDNLVNQHQHIGGKLCPMCEAAFPDDIDEEAFESHVVEHFCFEDAETLKYVPIEEG